MLRKLPKWDWSEIELVIAEAVGLIIYSNFFILASFDGEDDSPL